MKRFRLVAAGLVLLVTGVMNPVAAHAVAVSGNVMLGTKSTQAVVAAVPLDASTGIIDADRAVTVFTGLNGRFTITPPSEQFMLVAWNGSDAGIVFEPVNGVTIHLLRQDPPIVTAANTWCTCTRLFWGLYYTCWWADWGKIGCVLWKGCQC
ncbi:MAG: hypothetical protein HY567_02300 [Candidatus Kerfeldbacteria bacterium]|nr:hypothetical protein [Candidatus Kerfeldbacteria bacterium]